MVTAGEEASPSKASDLSQLQSAPACQPGLLPLPTTPVLASVVCHSPGVPAPAPPSTFSELHVSKCPCDFLALRTSSVPSSSHTQMSSWPSPEAPDALKPLLSLQHPAALSGSPCWMQLCTRAFGPVRVPWLVGSHRCHQKELVPCPRWIFGYVDTSDHWGWKDSRCGGGQGLWVSTELPRGP